MNLRIFDSSEELMAAAARAIVSSNARSIALSGGSTPQPLYKLLGESLRDEPITWVVVDERYVPIDDPQSNAGMINSTLMPPPERFLRFHTELADPAATVDAFEAEWRARGLENLDLVILGVGDDGHTASLFPGTPALEVEDRIATAVFVEKLATWRVTITKPVIRAAKLRIVLVTGASKREVLTQVRDGGDYPIAQATSGVETWWFVDRAAAPTFP
jgi:6-phosphogluconolactonase